MYRRVSDFLAGWEEERAATLKILSALDDRSLQQAAGADHRTLGRLAWHITVTIPEMMERTGLRLAGPAQDAPPPTHAAEIVRSYDGASRSLADEVRARWDDAALEVEDDMYGERWPRGRTLSALLAHQTHHRGQMTVLMRQAGLRVPGVYGPSREEWSAFGMQPPAV
ncbi:MAG TPA: DinB family protein [Vicinamibacteria bacterium]|nr:DinB family protein [Vicinamibacteria bacterium]